MKYSELIDPEYSMSPDSELLKKYKISRAFYNTSYFINFSSWQIRASSNRAELGTNWKARISINPEDMNDAWDVVFPILYQKNIPFKIANPHAVAFLKNTRQEKLDALVDEYNLFLEDGHSQKIDHLRNIFHSKYQQLTAQTYSQWRLIAFIQTCLTQLASFFYQYTLDTDHLFTQTQNIYEHLIDVSTQKLVNSLRFHEGMQFTLYMLPGDEAACQDALEEIETNLTQAKIRPGKIFNTDRPIGLYSSIRHPGKWQYHPATDPNLHTYNPDNIEDPFRCIQTNPPTAIIASAETSTRLIIASLQTKQSITPLPLETPAAHKENPVKPVRILPLEIEKELIPNNQVFKFGK